MAKLVNRPVSCFLNHINAEILLTEGTRESHVCHLYLSFFSLSLFLSVYQLNDIDYGLSEFSFA